MMRGLYHVKGDFNLMLKWDDYFGGSRPQPKQERKCGAEKYRYEYHADSLDCVLGSCFHQQTAGCLLSILTCAIVPLVYYRNKKTVYDVLSGVLVTGFSVVMLAGAAEK